MCADHRRTGAEAAAAQGRESLGGRRPHAQGRQGSRQLLLAGRRHLGRQIRLLHKVCALGVHPLRPNLHKQPTAVSS